MFGGVRKACLSLRSHLLGVLAQPSWKWNPAEHLADVEDELDLGGF